MPSSRTVTLTMLILVSDLASASVVGTPFAAHCRATI